MPSLLPRQACPACSRLHAFVLPGGHVVAGEEYAYCCPQTGRPTAVLAAEPGVPVSFVPQGAVVLTRTRVGGRRAA